MAINRRKPRNASLRFQSFLDTNDITKKKPEKKLVKGKRRIHGRNAYGRITVRHRGGGVARKYRHIDFKREHRDIPGTVIAIEYDPNRNVRIALVVYKNGAKCYMLMPSKLAIGDMVISGESVDAKVGNCMPLKKIPSGFQVHNIEMVPGSGGILVRSAGGSAQVMGKNNEHVSLKMPSGEVRMFRGECWATIGVLGNADYKNISLGKAGRKRRMGFRPSVRGMAMNPVDHPHGGGEGRSKSGSHPVSPTGKGCKGMRTRKKRNKNPLIVSRRKKK